MTDLLAEVITAHGGLDRWNEASTLRARVVGGGGLWGLKGQDGVMDDVVTTIALHRQHTSHAPFGGPGLHGDFTPGRVAVETDTGTVVAERSRPRAAFAGHDVTTAWDRLHLAYFTGYAMWTYLTEPYSLTGRGFIARELEPWTEDGHAWRRLEVIFPEDVVTHSRRNVYYIDAAGLIRRHDYVPEVLGPNAGVAAHYSDGHRRFGGLLLPTRRRVYLTDARGHPVRDPLIVRIDIGDVVVS